MLAASNELEIWLGEYRKSRRTAANAWDRTTRYLVIRVVFLVQEQMKEPDARRFDLNDITEGARELCSCTISMTAFCTMGIEEVKHPAL